MWLVVKDGKVIMAQPNNPGDIAGCEVFEWFGSFEVYTEAHTTPEGYPVPEVAGLDPRPPGYDTGRDKFNELAGLLTNEIDWLDTTIPEIDEMDAAQLQAVIKRLAQENRYMLRAWLYTIKKLGDD
jgi:hypothetical protein